MTGDILGVSISGLRVSQNAIRTTGHNIANANTEGYSRQSTEINSVGGSLTGAGYLGSGAFTANIERVVNEFVNTQMRQDTSLYGELSAYNENILKLDDLLANESTGLTVGLQNFFASMQNATDDPTSVASRQLLISEANNLSDRFNTLYSRMETISDGVNTSIASSISTINTLALSLAQINRSIGEAYGNSDTQLPNDLLDQRDQVLQDLSKLVNIQVAEQDGNQINVTVGNGLPLVVGYETNELAVGSNEFDPSRPEIIFANSSVSEPVTRFFTGGEISGLLDFENTVIQDNFNLLGRIALSLSDDFNRLQSEGITLNGSFGQNIFEDINSSSASYDRIIPSENNTTSDQQLSVSITDIERLTSSNYLFELDDSTNIYRVMRLSDNAEVASAIMPETFPASITFDGLSIDLAAGTYSNGDQFLIQPTRYGARDFGAMTLLPEDIALGSPIVTDTNSSNIGSAQISAGEVLQITDTNGVVLPTFAQSGALSPPLLIQFTTATTYDVLDNSDPGNPVQLNPPIRNQTYVPGIENSLFSEDVGQTTVTSGGTALGLPAANTTANAYPAETLSFTTTNPETGSTSTQNLFTTLNASAKTTAASISTLDGVSATAFNYLELRDFSVTLAAPLQISLNGEDLVQYEGAALSPLVPDPNVNSGEDFNDYLAEQINANSNLSALGIYAVSAYDAANSEFYIQIHSTQGDDLTVGLEATASEVIEVNDGRNADVAITATGVGTTDTLVVGGSIDVTMNSNIVMSTSPSTSTIFGDSTASSFAQSVFLGLQASISGTPDAGDEFTIGYNTNAAMDNRNGLAMVELQGENRISNGTQSYSVSYDNMIEQVGVQAHSSTINTEAAKNVLDQTESLRNQISGVNLDEEAADLIRFEQLYSANARVISVARELFDDLLNSI